MKMRLSGGLLSALLLSASPLAAQDASTISDWISGNVAVTSDYAFRGISQTLEEPALQGGMDLEHPSGFYVGTWGSSVNFGEDLSGGPRAQLELDVYGGFGASLGGLLDLDLGAIYYMYPGASGTRNYDFLELGLGASRSIGAMGVGVNAAYSPDFYAGSGTSYYYGGSVDVPVAMVTLSGSVGRQLIETNSAFGTPDYTNWSVGAGVDLFGFSVGGQVVGTNLDDDECFGGSDYCATRAIVSLSRAM